MTADQLQEMIATGLPCSHLEVQGDGRHWYAVVVSEAFEGVRPIARHQKVYATLGERMGGEIHALALRTLTPEEAERAA